MMYEEGCVRVGVRYLFSTLKQYMAFMKRLLGTEKS